MQLPLTTNTSPTTSLLLLTTLLRLHRGTILDQDPINTTIISSLSSSSSGGGGGIDVAIKTIQRSPWHSYLLCKEAFTAGYFDIADR